MPGTKHRYQPIRDADGHTVGLRVQLTNGAGTLCVDYDLDELIKISETIGHAGAELRHMQTVLAELRDVDPQIRPATVETILDSHVAGMAAALDTLFEKP